MCEDKGTLSWIEYYGVSQIGVISRASIRESHAPGLGDAKVKALRGSQTRAGRFFERPLHARSAPDPQRLPLVLVALAPLSAYETLLGSGDETVSDLGEAA